MARPPLSRESVESVGAARHTTFDFSHVQNETHASLGCDGLGGIRRSPRCRFLGTGRRLTRRAGSRCMCTTFTVHMDDDAAFSLQHFVLSAAFVTQVQVSLFSYSNSTYSPHVPRGQPLSSQPLFYSSFSTRQQVFIVIANISYSPKLKESDEIL